MQGVKPRGALTPLASLTPADTRTSAARAAVALELGGVQPMLLRIRLEVALQPTIAATPAA